MTRNLLILISVCATLIVAGCTGPPEQPSVGEVYSDRGATPRQSQTATQTLYLATQQCPIFDPAQDQWDTGNGIGTPPLVPEIHAGLMRFTDDMQNPVEHDLAESYTVTPDYKSYTFTLRPNLRFSDGSHITAQDFKTSWERALQIGRERGYAHQMLGDIVGAAAVRDRSSSDLAGVTVIDERTLDIEIAAPNAQFGMLMAHPVSFVVKADQTQLWDTLWPDTFNDIVAEAYEPGYPAPNRILPKLLQPMVGEVVPISQAEAREIPTALQQERVKGTFRILDDSETERFLYATLLSNLTERWWQQFGIDIRVTSPEPDASHADQPYD